MRTRPFKEYESVRERIAETRLAALIAGKPRGKRIAQVWGGRLLRGIASSHNLPYARRWRTVLRIKDQTNREKT